MTVTAAPDVLLAAQTLLNGRKGGTAIETLTVRCYYLEPTDQPPVILLEEAGALDESGVGFYSPFRVALRCYGETMEHAARYMRTAKYLLHRTGQATVGGMLIGQILEETGPQPLYDERLGWPMTWGVFGFYMADQVTA